MTLTCMSVVFPFRFVSAASNKNVVSATSVKTWEICINAIGHVEGDAGDRIGAAMAIKNQISSAVAGEDRRVSTTALFTG